MTKKRGLIVKLPLVAELNPKQRAALAKGNAILRKYFASPENRALIDELAGSFARAAVDRMIDEQTQEPASRPKAKRQRPSSKIDRHARR